MRNTNFPAILRDENENVAARGLATVSVEGKSVDFSCDFVPLYPMGKILEVVRTHSGREVHSFTGSVYLSTREFLRITNVVDEVLEEVGLVHSANASILGEVIPVPAKEPVPRLRLLLKKLPSHSFLPCDVLVYSISSDIVRFTCTEQFAAGSRLVLKTGTPLSLSQVVVEVEKLIIFGEKITGHHCKIVSLPREGRSVLEEYSKAYSLSRRKLF